MARHNGLLLLGFFFLFNAPVCAQGPAASSPQSAPKTSGQQAAAPANAPIGTGSATVQGVGVPAAALTTTEYAIAQSIINAQALSGRHVTVLFVQPPPSPTLAYADFWNAISDLRERSSQFLTNLSTAFTNDPIGVGATALSSGTGLILVITGSPSGFEEIDTGLNLVAGGISDSVTSTIADLLGENSVDLSTGGATAANNLYTVLSTANTASDIADQGANASQPQILPVQPPEMSPPVSPIIQPGQDASSESQSAPTIVSPPTNGDAAILDLNADAEVQISSELVDNQAPSAMSFSGATIVDSGSLIRPQAPTIASSGGFLQNLTTALQIANLALQAYQMHQATSQTHTPAATSSGRKQQVQSPAGKQQPSCSSPEECAAIDLVKRTCAIRNDCIKWGGPAPSVPPPLPPLPAPTPGSGCNIQCGYRVASPTPGSVPSFECWGNAFTPACPYP